ncbi:ketopantoate reductase PanE/ApbA C terminal-domain-containing protein [Cristinia sonorae]|uniref:2-dehydropantoate 2-reductase n=1 Tax=Cristinia sonorae TaxID=1940300 RepID=A0A8K0UHN0_9AGAR|nr:ketopantoate reductase PanE/ApbA C terminal-domain-containing protein [Cristinia sonorae]
MAEAVDVCVVGFGAIGALYAWALERSGKARVTAVCRSNHDVLHDLGLEFHSDKLGRTTDGPWRPYRVVRTVEDAADRTYAYILCATKCIPEVLTTPSLLSPLLPNTTQPETNSPVTTIVLLQNGVGIEDDLIAYLNATNDLDKKVVVVSGCAWVDTTAVDGGKKITQFGTERLVLGVHKYSALDGQQELREFCDALILAGSDAVPVEDIDAARWRKVLWNASFSTLCTLTRTTVGHVLSLPTGRAELASIMHEVLAVARASLSPHSALSLPDTVVQEIIAHENPESVFKPSMLVDLEAGRPMEVEAIVGGVLKRAKNVGVQVPKLELIYAGLSLIQKELLEKK